MGIILGLIGGALLFGGSTTYIVNRQVAPKPTKPRPLTKKEKRIKALKAELAKLEPQDIDWNPYNIYY